MKRSKKLPFKAETLRQLTGQELHAAQGGAYYAYDSKYCQVGNDQTANTHTGDAEQYEYNYNYNYQR